MWPGEGAAEIPDTLDQGVFGRRAEVDEKLVGANRRTVYAAGNPPEVSVNISIEKLRRTYHMEDDEWYGKKHGQYMTEAEAQKAGYHKAKKPNAKTDKTTTPKN
jgi:hypothetical protein